MNNDRELFAEDLEKLTSGVPNFEPPKVDNASTFKINEFGEIERNPGIDGKEFTEEELDNIIGGVPYEQAKDYYEEHKQTR